MQDDQYLHLRYDDDILIATFIKNVSITEEVAKQMVAERKAFTGNREVKVLIIFPKLSNMDKGGRDYLSTDEAKEGIKAGAVVTKSMLARVIINFFMKLNNNDKDPYPSKIFNTEEEALKWLKSVD